MTCRQFEDGMETVFASVDRDTLRAQLINERWEEIAEPDQSEHLSRGSDCVQSLLQFLEIRGLVDYRSQPCFHVAYYSADVPSGAWTSILAFTRSGQERAGTDPL